MTKCHLQILKKSQMLSPSYIILRIQGLEGKHIVDLDEVAHYEPPHQDLRYLQILMFTPVLNP